MASAKMTLIGMYNYRNDIFNELVLPSGIDADLFKQSLLMKGGEFEVLYPDPDFLKYSIKIWSSKWFRTFSEWLRGTEQRWNPIYNYDRFEESRNENRKEFDSKTTADYSDQRKVDLDDTRTADLTEKRTADLEDENIKYLTDKRTADLNEKTTFDNADTTTQTDQMTTEHQVAAYDSSSYSPSSKDIVNNGQSTIDHTGDVTNATTGTDINEHSGTDTIKHTGTDTTEHTGTDIMKHTGTDNTARKGTLSDNTGSEQTHDIHEAHLYGNIGVTTSAAMLKEFYDVSSWSLYDHMSDVFISELLIPVY